ncbi:sensor histidine kinase [Agathobaculum sp.]|uniref:sensor histidine kinase n=1 Tax=Agathobaculum sp. TaxID=2048138 RepID=UPI002A8133A0|nr:HAMP domain-containing sensor histidine kinase [Agathobaculum sp.]MDY3618748.1 HAMP domain-containing sensor histidine kinase [Agathobaculum sp.]
MKYAVIAAFLLAALVVVYDRLRLRRSLKTLNRLLDAAISGDFSEKTFDESRLSALESKLAHWLNAQVNAAGRMREEKTRMQALIADISHQTKTPVAGILLYAGLLSEQELPADCRAYVEALTGQAEKLRFLIDALIKAGRLETGVIAVNPELSPVQPLLRDAADGARGKAEEKGVALTLAPCEASACFDPKWTREALSNLVDNAVKYTPAGGSVTLSAKPYELFCRIDVSDTGIGVPEHEQARIFERFARGAAVSQDEGVGLGLYLAREIAAAEGGYIKVASTPGTGSTFSLFLPRGI